MTSRTSLASWQKLIMHAQAMKDIHISDLFAADSQRFAKYSLTLPSFLLDYSKNLINQQTMALLFDLAKECEVETWRDKMFSGEKINKTENRAVLHTALRNRSSSPIKINDQDINPDIELALDKMNTFSTRLRNGEWRGYSGKAISDVVNIGVGGSNLGPQMVTEALKQYSDNIINIHYVSNVDGTQIANVLRYLNPETTLFIISSKTFTTVETMTNAKTAINWLTASATQSEAMSKHVVAVSANRANAMAFGIAKDNIFDMWDWVGGRFSLWSAIGLPIAIDLGFARFIELLEGAHQVDKHFLTAPIEQNPSVILALLSVWNCTFLGAQSQAILPYDQSLHMLSAYLQQAEMESNGKSVCWDGKQIFYPTVPSIWGELGINGQHAFYQYLHQSNNIVPADFIGSVATVTPIAGHHETLMANFFAQTQALMAGVNEQQVRADLTAKGRNADYINKVAAHKVHQGNRPTNTILLNQISAHSLGGLIALYEHKIFVQGIILKICSFDQWGVELGKGLAEDIANQLNNQEHHNQHDSSTEGLINYYKAKTCNV